MGLGGVGLIGEGIVCASNVVLFFVGEREMMMKAKYFFWGVMDINT